MSLEFDLGRVAVIVEQGAFPVWIAILVDAHSAKNWKLVWWE